MDKWFRVLDFDQVIPASNPAQTAGQILCQPVILFL